LHVTCGTPALRLSEPGAQEVREAHLMLRAASVAATPLLLTGAIGIGAASLSTPSQPRNGAPPAIAPLIQRYRNLCPTLSPALLASQLYVVTCERRVVYGPLSRDRGHGKCVPIWTLALFAHIDAHERPATMRG